MQKAQRGLLLAVAVIGSLSIALQFGVNMTTRDLDRSLAWRLVNFFSYFTVTTDLLIVAVSLACVLRPHSWLARPSVAAATAGYAMVVAAAYQWFLRTPAPPHSLALYADTGMHELAPVL